MLTMDQVKDIRRLYYEQGLKPSEIAEKTGRNYKTVLKYIDKEDFNSSPPEKEGEKKHPSKLDLYKPTIDRWLMDDKKAPRKQRHTAARVYHRLKQMEGFRCSYRLVAQYVAAKKKELNLGHKEGYLPLVHYPGEGQGDFGYADFDENGRRYHGKYFVLSFPQSNGGYLQLHYGENMECLLESLVAIFEYIGGVPTEIWFDNTSTIVTKIIRGGGRDITERFERFSQHYRFTAKFMNPESGWEKGNVENKVGYLRRNELVPVPAFTNLAEYNAKLMSSCDDDMKREHYEFDDGTMISDLFAKDRAALIPLPSVAFDTALYMTARTDNYGKFTLEGGKHEYSASPAFCRMPVSLKITSAEVIVLDDKGNEVVRHRRLYGDQKQSSMNWLPYLRYIARKPRSLRNTGIYDMMPGPMQTYMDAVGSPMRGRVLKILSDLTDRTGFESAVNTVTKAISYQATDPDSLQALYNRLYSDVPLLPELDNHDLPDSAKVILFQKNDLSKLDQLLKGGAANG